MAVNFEGADSAKILVVDDTPANLEVITDALISAGYETAVAISGDRALRRLKANVSLPDLILLDVQMPGLDGFETCRQIKAMSETQHIPIIFITALLNAESIAKGFSVGAVDYIGKPFNQSELLARVNTHLRLKKLNQSLEKQVSERTYRLETALAELRESQLQLVQHEKMSALGNLVAGVAHEINNPLGFVSGNITEIRHSLKDLTECLQCYRKTFPEPGDELADLLEELEIDFVLADLPKMLDSMQVGCQRINSISNSLRTFSRADTESKFKANVHEGLDSTLLILKYRLKANDWRPEIEVIRDYGELPEVDCFIGQLSQVFMNILANAIDMFDESAEGRAMSDLKANPQRIAIKTKAIDAHEVEISISDNGNGMSEAVCAKIFDRGFTTKQVGKGTGLGLAIAHQVVVEKHGGHLTVHSEIGQGTLFSISLPIESCIGVERLHSRRQSV